MDGRRRRRRLDGGDRPGRTALPRVGAKGRDAGGPAGRAGRRVRGEIPRDRDDRHRQRAGRPDVDGPVPGLREPVRRRRAGRDDLDLDEEQGPAGRHSDAARRLRAGAAEPAAAPAGFPDRRGAAGASSSPGQPAYGMAAVGPDKMSRRRRAHHRAPPSAPTRGRCGCSRGAAPTRSRRRCCRRARRARRHSSRRWSRSCASTRSPIRTMPGRGFAGSFRRCTTSRCRRRPTATSTTSRRGPASAAIGSTRTRRAPTSRRSPTSG